MVDAHLLTQPDVREIMDSVYKNTIDFLEHEGIVSKALQDYPDMLLSQHSIDVQEAYKNMKDIAESDFSPDEIWNRFEPYMVTLER